MASLAVKQMEVVRDEENTLLSRHLEDIEKLLAEMSGDEDGEPFQIRDESDFEFVTELLLHIKKEKKQLEDRRKSVTKPLSVALENFRQIYRGPIQAWDRAEKVIKQKIGEWVVEKNRIEEEKMKQIAAAAKAGDFEAAHAVEIQETPKVKGISIQERWELAEVTDFSKVPDIMKTINGAAVDAYIKSFDNAKPKDVPGLRFHLVGKVRGSTKG